MEGQEKAPQSEAEMMAQIQKDLKEIMGEEVIETTNPETSQAPETQPENVETQTSPISETTTQEKPEAETEPPLPEVEKEWWEQESSKPEETSENWKVKYEEINAQLSKIKDNKLLSKLSELIDAPNFDLQTFLESQTAKKIDYTKVPLENLYKASLEDDKVANYTDAEIEELWEKKKSELSDSEALQKSLKSQLVKEFQSKDSVVSDEEPETFKIWKEEKQQQEQAAIKQKEKFEKVNQEITEHSKSMLGKKIAGLEIKQEHIDAINSRMNVSYYSKEDGSIDGRAIAVDRMKAVMFDELYKFSKKDAVIEAKKQMTRPSNQSGGGQIGETDDRAESEKIMDSYAQSKGFKNYKEMMI